MEYIIAFNIPKFANEQTFREIFYQYSCYSVSAFVHTIHDSKSAIIKIRNTYNIKSIIELINKKKVNGVFLDLILVDESTISFLINNKKTIYFQFNSHNVASDSIKSEFEKFGTVKEFLYNEKLFIGSVTFEKTESALKAKNDLDQKLVNGSTISINFTNLDSSISFFFEQIQKNQHERLNLKKGNESSIFVFDIPEKFDAKKLRHIFDEFNVIPGNEGVVINTKFNYDSKITKYAIITFYNKIYAKKAIEKLNYKMFNGIPIRLVPADSDTIKILATNKGKLLISNLNNDIQVSLIHNLFADFGEVIECEIPSDEGVSRGYAYVHFRNEQDALKAKRDLSGASFDGKEVVIDLLEEVSPNDLEKKYLKEINFSKNYCTQKDIFNFRNLFIPDFSLFGINDNNFIIFVNDKKIDCNRFLVSFISPKIANNIKNDESLSYFVINIISLDKSESMNLDLVNFLVSLLDQNPSKSKLQKTIFDIAELIISSTIEEKLDETIKMIIDGCSDVILGKIDNNDQILYFILLIEVFAQFGNEMIIEYSNSLLFQNIQFYDQIENDQVLYIKHSIRKIMKRSEENYDEIEYIASNFTQIDPQILNKIDSEIIEKSISMMEYRHTKNNDRFLYQILRLRDDYKKQFIHFVNFEEVTNKAMKNFLSSFDFSIFNGKLFESLSKRLSLKFLNEEDSYDEQNDEFSNIFSQFIKCGIENSLSKRIINEKDFTILIGNDNKQININSKIASILSPTIKRNFQTDKTFSSFYLRFDSQINFFNEFTQSLSYFINKKDNFYEFDRMTIENKIIDLLIQMNDMIDNQGINHLTIFLTTFHINEKNAFNYAGWIFLFICLGNFSISEFLVNWFIKSHDPEITSNEDVIERLHHKEILKYQDSFEIDISSERVYLINNFESFFTNVLSLEDINENLWKILSIRLSVDVRIESKEYHFNNYGFYNESSDSDAEYIA